MLTSENSSHIACEVPYNLMFDLKTLAICTLNCIFTRDSSARTSYLNSVCPSRPYTDSSPGETETPGFTTWQRSLSSFLWENFVTLGEEIPLERGHQTGVPTLKIIILPLLTRLPRKRLPIDTDLLFIITSTAEDLSGGTKCQHRWSWTTSNSKNRFLVTFCDSRLL